MSRFIIDDRAVEFIKETMKKEDAQAVRIFISGGGCCRRLEITPVKKALSGDATYTRGGITVHIEKGLVDNASTVEINFDEQKGLLINLYE